MTVVFIVHICPQDVREMWSSSYRLFVHRVPFRHWLWMKKKVSSVVCVCAIFQWPVVGSDMVQHVQPNKHKENNGMNVYKDRKHMRNDWSPHSLQNMISIKQCSSCRHVLYSWQCSGTGYNRCGETKMTATVSELGNRVKEKVVLASENGSFSIATDSRNCSDCELCPICSGFSQQRNIVLSSCIRDYRRSSRQWQYFALWTQIHAVL